MISGITAKIFSELGSNSSLLPMGVKDVSNSLGMTAGSYLASKNKIEGKDRFIDEFGAQGIWLFGLPVYKKLIDLTAYKIAGYNSKIDTRVLKDKKIKDLAIKYAPTEKIKDSFVKAAEHNKLFKGLFIAKFVAATALTMLSYGLLTAYRHKYTEKEQISEIKKEIAQDKANQQAQQPKQKTPVSFQAFNKNKAKTVSFGSGLASVTNIVNDFMFNPVKNMMILDGGITGERLKDSRNKQDFIGYVIKEGGFWFFMYVAGKQIQKFLEKRAFKKHHKSIDLDIKVLQDEDFQKAIGNKAKTQGELDEFLYKIENGKKVLKTDDEIYEFILNKPENIVVKTAKKSGMISEYQEYSDNFFEKLQQKLGLKKAVNTGKIDTQKFIDLTEKDGIRGIHTKITKLLDAFHNPKNKEKTIEAFFDKVTALKRFSILKNIGACIGFLGIVIPGIMVIQRKMDKNNQEFQVKKELKEKIKNGEVNLA